MSPNPANYSIVFYPIRLNTILFKPNKQFSSKQRAEQLILKSIYPRFDLLIPRNIWSKINKHLYKKTMPSKQNYKKLSREVTLLKLDNSYLIQ